MAERMLKGLVWGHRRATGPIEPLTGAFREHAPNVDIRWTVRPLSDFEHQPMNRIAGEYDLLIVDHPFSGDIAQSRAFLPLDANMPDLVGPENDRDYVGPSLPSYRYDGHVWAAPIDAATSHAAARADLLHALDLPTPRNWGETIALGRKLKARGKALATPVVSPHAFATVASLMANLGKPIATDPAMPLTFDRDAMATALEALEDLLAYCPPETRGWNAISLSEAMVERDDIVFTPSVYGYATYAEADLRAPLTFSDFCGLRSPFEAGSMLGGTGLAVSASSRDRDAALAFVRFCLSPEAQDRIIPEHHGQPARVSAWENSDNDRRFRGYYKEVRRSMEAAWIRPRRPNYILFQATAGRAVEAFCNKEISKASTLDRVEAEAARTGDHAPTEPD